MYLRPDHEGVHRTLDVVRRYLLALGGVRVGRTRVGVDHLRAERDAHGDLLSMLFVLQRLVVMTLMMLERHDACGTAAVVVVDGEVVGRDPPIAGVAAQLHLLLVLIVQLHLHATSAQSRHFVSQSVLTSICGFRTFPPRYIPPDSSLWTTSPPFYTA